MHNPGIVPVFFLSNSQQGTMFGNLKLTLLAEVNLIAIDHAKIVSPSKK